MRFTWKNQTTGEKVAKVRVEHLVGRRTLVNGVLCAAPLDGAEQWLAELARPQAEEAVRLALLNHGRVDIESNARGLHDDLDDFYGKVEARVDELFPDLA